jgi:hypothetical protein
VLIAREIDVLDTSILIAVSMVLLLVAAVRFERADISS